MRRSVGPVGAARSMVVVLLLAAGLVTTSHRLAGFSHADEPSPRELRKVNVPGLARLPAFSHATVAGRLVFVSGTLGTEGDTLKLVEGGTGPQTTQALANIERILRHVGADRRDIARVNVFLADMATFDEMNRAYVTFFGPHPPARTTVGVSGLALGAAVEIQCVAQLPAARRQNAGSRRRNGSPTQQSTAGEQAPSRAIRGEEATSQDQEGAAPDAGTIAHTWGTLEIDGEQIYYETSGDAQQPAIVLCHGYGGNHAVWYQQVPTLARWYRVVTWDARGFGRSTNRQRKAGPATSAHDLLALLDHLKIERAHLVGQSMGGWTVMGLALEHADRVESLTLADTIAGVYTPEISRQFDAYIAQARAHMPADGRFPLGRHPALDEAFSRQHPARAFLYQQLASLAEPPPKSIPALLRLTSYDHARLGALQVPTLWIVGQHDPIFTPESIRRAARLMRHAQVVEIAGAGHSPYFERPKAWNRALLAFLNGGE